MRTKALLCAAGLLAAGVASSMAQSNVYSLNVVGYIQQYNNGNPLGLTNGFNLIANQFDKDFPATFTNNTVDGIFSTNMPNLTKVYGYNPATGTYGIATYFSASGVWSGGQPTVNAQLAPGKGVWVQIPGSFGTPTPIPLTLVGNVVEGTNTLPVKPGFQILSIIPPLSARLKTDMGYAPSNLDKVYTYNPVAKAYTIRTYFSASGVWSPNEPTPAVGEAFWLNATATNNWTQKYTVPRP